MKNGAKEEAAKQTQVGERGGGEEEMKEG